QLHDVLVRLPGADDSVVRPHGDPHHSIRWLPPFHLLDHIWIGLLDERSDAGKQVAAPIVQRLDSGIELVRERVSSCSFVDAFLGLLHDGRRFLRGASSASILIWWADAAEAEAKRGTAARPVGWAACLAPLRP